MFDPTIEVLVLAAIALAVMFRLYTTLGRGEDDAPMPRQQTTDPNAKGPSVIEPAVKPKTDERPIFVGPAAGGLEDIYNADNSFSESEFMSGARAAYKLIVDAFGRGDLETLKPLLDWDVYEAWEQAIAARDEGAPHFFVLRFRKVEIEGASLTAGTARINVRFESELGDGETTRSAREIWTFMRDVSSNDPNWLLDDVEIAN